MFLIAISFTFCAMKQELQNEFPQEIKSVFYQKVEKGNQEYGIHFYIVFKKPLAETIELKKIYFHNQTARVVKITNTTFVAHFKENNKKEDLILDLNPVKEYGNKAPVLEKSKFDLKNKEAVLEYKNDNKRQFFKIANPIEKADK